MLRRPVLQRSIQTPESTLVGCERSANSTSVSDQSLFTYLLVELRIMTANFVPPNQQRSLRACMVCSIVQTQQVSVIRLYPMPSDANMLQRFIREGCPNCDDFLHLQGSSEAVADCTSQVFEGLITLSNPSRSWVAKWQRLDGYVRGVYATKVSGILPEDVVDQIEGDGRMRYVP